MLKSGGVIVRLVVVLLIYEFCHWVGSLIVRHGRREDEDLFNRYRALRQQCRQGVYDLLRDYWYR